MSNAQCPMPNTSTSLSTSAQYFSTRGFSFRDANANANDFAQYKCPILLDERLLFQRR
ncbi:MAG: hypothetical protein V7K14_22220 [Nostoc sp.]|uniref:hypothetical protein n=1 Tax=Nostoc sp. TaxID=1180 RepID=UPI002FF7E044